eukprot:TRINITY_DN5043_c0_g1_i1.p1 TRINITY_DN5043_c0_g1~~TRINITY_DN5043_c0_g1_i1.p1  ORF type:complete len:227 (+),score=68.23 TRINITY_DN5043_c0_g1_i1:63-743(+)
MTDVEYYEEEIFRQERDLEKQIEVLATSSGDERRDLTRRIEERLKKVRKQMVSYKEECKHCKDGTKRQQHEKNFTDHEESLRLIEKKFNDTRSGGASSSNSVPMMPSSSSSSGNPPGDTKGVFKQIDGTQDASLASLARTRAMAAEAEATAVTINTNLRTQTEKLGRIDEELQTLQGQLKRAKKDLVWFMRNAKSDKCFLSLLFLVIICFGFIIVWKIFGNKWKKS